MQLLYHTLPFLPSVLTPTGIMSTHRPYPLFVSEVHLHHYPSGLRPSAQQCPALNPTRPSGMVTLKGRFRYSSTASSPVKIKIALITHWIALPALMLGNWSEIISSVSCVFVLDRKSQAAAFLQLHEWQSSELHAFTETAKTCPVLQASLQRSYSVCQRASQSRMTLPQNASRANHAPTWAPQTFCRSPGGALLDGTPSSRWP